MLLEDGPVAVIESVRFLESFVPDEGTGFKGDQELQGLLGVVQAANGSSLFHSSNQLLCGDHVLARHSVVRRQVGHLLVPFMLIQRLKLSGVGGHLICVGSGVDGEVTIIF